MKKLLLFFFLTFLLLSLSCGNGGSSSGGSSGGGGVDVNSPPSISNLVLTQGPSTSKQLIILVMTFNFVDYGGNVASATVWWSGAEPTKYLLPGMSGKTSGSITIDIGLPAGIAGLKPSVLITDIYGRQSNTLSGVFAVIQ